MGTWGPGAILAVALLSLGAAGAAAGVPQPDAEAERLARLAGSDLRAFAAEVAGDATSDLEATRRIVRWFTGHFDWLATDYKVRSVSEIIDRRGGNCADLAKVARAALEALDLEMREVREVNIHREDPERGRRAAAMVAERGPRLSVFGRHHNDHVWLEIRDRTTSAWFPADPSTGLVGEDEWIAARVGFGSRATLNPLSEDMLVPMAIFAVQDGALAVSRTRHYLVDGFNRLYGDSLEALPRWTEWTTGLEGLEPAVLGAFQGKHDLHQDDRRIDDLWRTYEALKHQYLSRGTSTKEPARIER